MDSSVLRTEEGSGAKLDRFIQTAFRALGYLLGCAGTVLLLFGAGVAFFGGEDRFGNAKLTGLIASGTGAAMIVGGIILMQGFFIRWFNEE